MKNPFEVENVDNSNKVNSWNQDFEQKRLDGLRESSGPAMVITRWKSQYTMDGRENLWLKGRCHAISDVRLGKRTYTQSKFQMSGQV